MVAHLTCSMLSRNAPGHACQLDVKPMRFCPEFRNNTPKMLVTPIVDVQLAAVSHSDIPVHLILAGDVKLQLCHMN